MKKLTYVYFCDKIVENLLKFQFAIAKGGKNMKFRNESKLLSNIKWEFRKLKVALMRKKLEQSDFYEDVTFSTDIFKEWTQDCFAIWMYDLKRYHQIEIKKFKDLFENSNEIGFPIQIKRSSGGGIDINFIDRNGEEYYIYNRSIYDYYKMKEYYIGKRDTLSEPPVDKSYHYRMCKGGAIVLVETSILKLEQDENSETMCEILYNYSTNTEEIIMHFQDRKIKIEYPIRDNKIRKEIVKYIWECVETKWYFYDVFPVLKWMENIIEKDATIHIVAEINNEVFSEIKIEDGIVQKYTVTQIINEGEMHIIQKIFTKKIEEFLLEMTSH